MKYLTKEWYDLMQKAYTVDRSLRAQVDNTINAYWAEYKRNFPTPPDFMKMPGMFHDRDVISAQLVGDDYAITLNVGDDEPELLNIVLQNATVKKQDIDKQAFEHREFGWCYDELYPTEKGYELHVLMFEYGADGMYDLIVECENICIAQGQ